MNTACTLLMKWHVDRVSSSGLASSLIAEWHVGEVAAEEASSTRFDVRDELLY